MKSPALQDEIVAHLRAADGPVTSRDLAARFLKIERGDEETCRRLLAPLLTAVPGLAHHPDRGWMLATRADPRRREPVAVVESPRCGASPLDVVVVASDGAGPSGSGEVRAVALLPVVAGEPCQEEFFPAGGLDEEGPLPPLASSDLEEITETIGDLAVVCHRAGREVEPIRRACAAAGIPFRPPAISVSRLGHLLLGLKANHAALDLGATLGLTTRGPDDCRGRVRLVAEAYLLLAARLREAGVASIEGLLEYQQMPAPPLDFSRYAFTPEDLKALPARPGVYRFLDRGGRVLYVGKARDLRSRVGSYFVPSARATAKGRAILDRVHSLRIDPVASELEAVLLEAALIAETRPPLNRQFEVHERPAPYGPRLDLAIALRDAPGNADTPPTCTVHLLRAGRYAGRVSGVRPAGGKAWEGLIGRVRGTYFAAPAAARVPGADEVDFDIDWQLVGSYLRAHRDEVQVLDLDECAGRDEAADRLRVLVEAECRGAGRVIAR
jgi:hypothetical protein